MSPAAPVYDYSQPIVINTYNTPSTDASAESTSNPQAVATAPAPESPQTAEKPTSPSTRRWRLSSKVTTKGPSNWISKPCGSLRKTR